MKVEAIAVLFKDLGIKEEEDLHILKLDRLEIILEVVVKVLEREALKIDIALKEIEAENKGVQEEEVLGDRKALIGIEIPIMAIEEAHIGVIALTIKGSIVQDRVVQKE